MSYEFVLVAIEIGSKKFRQKGPPGPRRARLGCGLALSVTLSTKREL
jgi:hypothetical protein